MIFLAVLLAILIALVFFLKSLKKCLSLIDEHNREMSPGLVWLNLIPVFGLGWLVYTVMKISHSVKNQVNAIDMVELGDGAYGVGLAMAICGIVSIIPLVGFVTGIAFLVLWIIYWVKIVEVNGKLERLVLRRLNYCPQCSVSLDTESTFCGGCGTSVTHTIQ